MHNSKILDIKRKSVWDLMTIFARLCRSEVAHGRAAMFIIGIWVFTNLLIGWKMSNPIKTWFFELIEDAIGSKAMKQFKKEEETKKSKSTIQPKQD